jgi:uncharacterized repeat protein (TIGR03803 family)
MFPARRLIFAVVIATAQSISLTSASAQSTYEVLTDFSTTSVRSPNAAVVRASDGNYYGTSATGGGAGDIFKMTPDGTVTVLHSFDGIDGYQPLAALVEGSDGDLYGTTAGGTATNQGTIFKITKSGDFTLLHSIAPRDPVLECYPEGFQLTAPLLEGADGNFYGTISNGGNCSGGNSYAFIFRISPTGTFELLPKPGWGEGFGAFNGLTRGADGAMYGSTWDSAGTGAGVLFRVTESGAYAVLHSFSIATEGFFSYGRLVQGADGLLYATTLAGGAFGLGTVYKFDLTTLTLTTLHSFKDGDAAGGPSRAGLIEGSDGWFYGTTNQGTPAPGGGAIFRINGSTGVIEMVHQFDPSAGGGGYGSVAELIEPFPGIFVGTTAGGGSASSQGVVFRLTVLPPNLQIGAVKAPASAAPGATINVRDTTRNAGTGAAGATTTRIWLSANKTLDGGDSELGTRSIPALAAGKQSAGSTDVTLPAVAPGAYFLLLQADADDDALESNETDNVKAKAIVLGPDLTIKAMLFTPTSPTSSTPTTITLTVQNAGGETAGASVTRLYRSANGKLDAGDPLLAELTLGALSVGSTATQSTTLTLPAGKYYVIAVCDASNVVVEASETNNLKKASKTIP